MAELQKAEIVERIKQARLEAGLTQPEMAELLDVTPRTYQNYESTRVPWALMGRISDATGHSVRWLLHGQEEPGASPELMRRLATLERKLDEVVSLVPTADDPGAALEQELKDAVAEAESSGDDSAQAARGRRRGRQAR